MRHSSSPYKTGRVSGPGVGGRGTGGKYIYTQTVFLTSVIKYKNLIQNNLLKPISYVPDSINSPVFQVSGANL